MWFIAVTPTFVNHSPQCGKLQYRRINTLLSLSPASPYFALISGFILIIFLPATITAVLMFVVTRLLSEHYGDTCRLKVAFNFNMSDNVSFAIHTIKKQLDRVHTRGHKSFYLCFPQGVPRTPTSVHWSAASSSCGSSQLNRFQHVSICVSVWMSVCPGLSHLNIWLLIFVCNNLKIKQSSFLPLPPRC